MVAPVVVLPAAPAIVGGAAVVSVPATAGASSVAVAGSSTALPLLAGLGAVALQGGVMAVTKGLAGWRAYSEQRIPQLQQQGLSYREAQRKAGEEFRQQSEEKQTKPKRTRPTEMKETKVRGAPKMTASIPLVVDARPDEAAAWDIAQGIVDFLLENSAPEDDFTAFLRQAEATYQRAKGETPEADQAEYTMGKTIGSVVLQVIARNGLTWDQLRPPQIAGRVVTGPGGVRRDLPEDTGGFSGFVSDVIESGIRQVPVIGREVDIDGDGDVGGSPNSPGTLELFAAPDLAAGFGRN